VQIELEDQGVARLGGERDRRGLARQRRAGAPPSVVRNTTRSSSERVAPSKLAPSTPRTSRALRSNR
jgi:hypothetical protein